MEVKNIESKKQNNTYVRYEGEEKVTGDVDGYMYSSGVILTGFTTGDKEKDYDFFNKSGLNEIDCFSKKLNDELYEYFIENFKYYRDGKKFTGRQVFDNNYIHTHLHFNDGELLSDDTLTTYDYIIKDGRSFKGFIGDIYYISGKPFTGTPSYGENCNKFYYEGELLLTDNNLKSEYYFNGFIDGVLFIDDKKTTVNTFEEKSYNNLNFLDPNSDSYVIYKYDGGDQFMEINGITYLNEDKFTGIVSYKDSCYNISTYKDGKRIDSLLQLTLMLFNRNKKSITVDKNTKEITDIR